MPEGDTIFRSARALNRALAGRRVTRFETVLAQLARVDDQSPIAGREVLRVTASGKHLLMELEGPLVLRTHLRMNGSWHIYRPDERWRRRRDDMRIVIGNEEYVAVGFAIPVAEFHAGGAAIEAVERLGPDPLGERFDSAEVVRRIEKHGDEQIGVTLLRQSVMAGVGNVFKSEALFLAGINPLSPVAEISVERLEALVDLAAALLRKNVREVRDPLAPRDHRRTTGTADPRGRLWVYGRGGQACRRCGTPIEAARLGEDARLTWWCPRCQPSGCGLESAKPGRSH